MKTITLFIAAVALVMGTGNTFAQKLAAENTLQISGKSKRGYLGNVVADDTKKQIDMVFVTKSTNKKVKFEVYQFDYDLKLINQFADEQEVEKAKTKYHWFSAPNGDVTSFKGVTAEGNLTGALVFKQKEVTMKYNWYTGGYKKEEKILDKIKPKSEDGKSYVLQMIGIDDDGKPMGASFDIDETGEVLAIVGEKGKVKDDPYKHQKEFLVMKANGNMDITIPATIPFENPQAVIYCGVIKEGAVNAEEVPMGDIAIVFAPIGGQGYGKIKQADATQYTYVRIGRDGTVKQKASLKTKCAKWTIDAVYQKDGSVFIYGPGKNLKEADDAYRGAYDAMQKAQKGFDNFQIAGIKGEQVLFVNAPTISEFETKSAKPDNQKKPVLYEGGKINIGGLDITSSGDIFVNLQEWSYDAVGNYRGNKYQDFMVMHFDKSGNLVKCYGIDNPQKTGLKGVADPRQDPKYYPTGSVIFESTDKNSAYWMQFIIGNVERRETPATFDWGTGVTTAPITWYTSREQVRIAKIDISSGKIGSFMTFGDGAAGGKKFYLMNEFPSVKINDGKQIIFIGEDTNKWGGDSSGDYLWLGKFDPSKL